MNPVDFMDKSLWLIVVAAICWQVWRPTQYVPTESDLREYRRLQYALASGLIFPWLIVGYGVLFGGVTKFWSFFRPQDGNPYVLAWFAAAFLMSLIYSVWVLFFDGDKKLVDFHLYSRSPMPPTATQIYSAEIWCLSVLEFQFARFLTILKAARASMNFCTNFHP
jgi:hypothetical protein